MEQKYRIKYKLTGGTKVFTRTYDNYSHIEAFMRDNQYQIIEVARILNYRLEEYVCNPAVMVSGTTIDNIDDMIDLALATHDREWFDTLMGRRALMIYNMERKDEQI